MVGHIARIIELMLKRWIALDDVPTIKFAVVGSYSVLHCVLANPAYRISSLDSDLRRREGEVLNRHIVGGHSHVPSLLLDPYPFHHSHVFMTQDVAVDHELSFELGIA